MEARAFRSRARGSSWIVREFQIEFVSKVECDIFISSNREIAKQLLGTRFVRGVETGCDQQHS